MREIKSLRNYSSPFITDNPRSSWWQYAMAVSLFVLLCCSASSALAQKTSNLTSKNGSILVEPKRVVIENGSHSGAVSLIRLGDDSGTYSITLSDIRMDENGVLTTLHDSTDRDSMSAKRIIRYFPHEVTLGPNESQIIRIQILNTAGLAPGEYRSHMNIKPVEVVKPITKLSDTSTAVGMKVSLLLGVAIPVIYRNRTTGGPVSITDLTIERDSSGTQSTLHLKLHRSGNQSLYGSLIAKFIPKSGDPIQIGLIKGIGVYTDIAYRNIKIPVDISKVDLTRGRIEVTFETYTGQPKETQLAKAEMQ